MSLSDLPLHPDVIELIDLIGWKDTKKLLKRFGGSRFYVAASLKYNHHLLNVIGLTSTKKLMHEFKTDVVDLPRCINLFNRKRNLDIQERVAAGESPDKLCIEYGMTRRHVYRLLKAVTKNSVDHNLDFFT